VARLSVALCTHQGERHLPEQLDSLRAQRRAPDELVVVDDASTDGTRALLERFAADAPFPVHLHLRDERRGAVRSFEQVLGLCDGDVVAFCDQDDRWHPDKCGTLEQEVRRGVDLAFCDGDLVDDDGAPRPLTLWQGVGFRGRRRERFERSPLPVLLNRSVVTGCASAFSAGLVDAALPFPDELHDERAPMLHDRWLSLVAATRGGVRAVPQRLLSYRVHPAQVTGIRRRRGHAHLPGLVLEEAQRPVADVAGASEAYLSQLRRLGERARAHGAPAGLVAEVDRACRHLADRVRLPAARSGRVRPVVRGLARGDYGRYGSGALSGVVDLVRPGPAAP
jgi:hypothetical protein